VVDGREWLETDGTGSYAMGPVEGPATRRYHGLLVAALHPPVRRHVILAAVEDAVMVDGRAADLDAGPGVLFRPRPMPTWTFDLSGDLRVERSVLLLPGRRTVILRWTASRSCRLRVRPLLAMRDHHTLARGDGADERVRAEPGLLRARPRADLPEVALHHDAARMAAGAEWRRGRELPVERARGYDFVEDLWSPGLLEHELAPDRPAHLAATIDPGVRLDAAILARLVDEEEARRTRQDAGSTLRARLEVAADAFLVRRADGTPTVIAGYPWFTDWGRDTMISLPGLLVGRGRLEEAQDVLAGFLAHLDGGLLPNRFPDGDEPAEHDTADATLWAFVAMDALVRAGGDRAYLRDVFVPRAREIVLAHERGTHHGIRVDPADGLLAAGAAGRALTWMDARIGEQALTPRRGKPVEVNALWHAALSLLADWSGALGDAEAARLHRAKADRVAASFRAAFWDPARRCLHDVVGPDGPDPSLRPNQIFAVSLPASPLGPAEQRAVVECVERHLLTPFGLRTLAPTEPAYQGRCEGDLAARDAAYHQGTVWPWLLGPFVTARLKVFGRGADERARCRALLAPLAAHLDEACLGQVSEIFDGDPPHHPRGAPAQAWSVAELLRVLSELETI